MKQQGITANTIHKLAWDHAVGKEQRDQRAFLFDFRIHDGQVLAYTRPMDAPCPLNAGGEYVLQTRLIPMTRHGKKEKRIRESGPMHEWIVTVFSRNGMGVEIIDLRAESLPLAHPSGPEFVLHTHIVTVVAKVNDLSAARKAWARGMGRHKAWGCGTLVLRQTQG